MKIINYEFSDVEDLFSPVKFSHVNLFVGASGSGKTRFFNTIFNLGSFICTNQNFKRGRWNLTFAIGVKNYEYSLNVTSDPDGKYEISEEKLNTIEKDGLQKSLLRREGAKCYFRDTELPKFPRNNSLIWSLREEEEIGLVHSNFGLILRRNFAESAIQDAKDLVNLPSEMIAAMDRKKSLTDIYHFPLASLSANLFLLKKVFPAKFELVKTQFCQIFTNITEFDVKARIEFRLPEHPDNLPLLAIKEAGVKDWIPIAALSSGMIKVLIILTDLEKFPDECIYMIDEYENSLGINAIDFLPDLIEQYPTTQFLITSHHPYILNNIDVRNWYVFNRKGAKTQIKYGDELADRYGLSKQDAFSQLINDPFFNNGGA